MNIIMLGPPGAGKGTISAKICDKYGICHISTGDIFRANLKEGTPLGILAKTYMDNGELVPDDVTTKMVLDRLAAQDCAKGYILDGFPRTIQQAEMFDKALLESGSKIDLVVLVEADEEKLIERLTSRVVCEKCGTSYNLMYMEPKVSGICDRCGGKLYQRKDDTREVIMNRLDVYKKETNPLVGYYQAKGELKVVNGFDSLDENVKKIGQMLA